MYASVCIAVVYNTAQTVPIIFTPNCQTIIIVQMLSIGGDGVPREGSCLN